MSHQSNPNMSNSCPQAAQIDAFLDSRLDHENRRRMADHLQRCEACREERAHLVALRRMTRALPRPEISAATVQRVKSALLERNRQGRPRRGAAELFADLFADRPLALHGAAIALGLLVSMACYGLGRFHQSRVEPDAGVASEFAPLARDRDAVESARLRREPRYEPRIEAFVDPTERLRGAGRGELVIEALEAPTPEDEVSSEIETGATLEPAPEIDRPERNVTGAASDRGASGTILLSPTAAALVPPRPVEFSAEALEVLEEAGSVSSVTRQIGDAAPNWAKILSESLLGPGGLLEVSGAASRETKPARRSSRNMIVLVEDGHSKLRLHITIRFGLDVEPQVEVRQAEARPLDGSAKPKR